MDSVKTREKLLEKANALPLCPGVYIMKDRFGKVIYVGKSKRLKMRVSQYFQNSEKNIKTAKMVSSVADFEYILCTTEMEALTLENTLIKQYTPRYNINLKDSKSYPYIKITAGDYPRIVATRSRNNDKGQYFGPYSGMGVAYGVIGALERTFGLPNCKRVFPRDIGKDRPCIYYQMKRCCGVCTGKVGKEEYGKLVKFAGEVLRGNTAKVRRALEADMLENAENERYESAARCRDAINALAALGEKQHVVGAPGSEEDVVGFYSDELCSVITFLYIRNGALTDRSEFCFGADEIAEKSDIAGFICRHYQTREYIPKNIYLSFDLDDEIELLKNFLNEKSGRKTEVLEPVKGEHKKLCDIADENAKEAGKRFCAEVEKTDEALVKLAEMLSLETLPERIEAYDVSNFGAEHLTAGMIVYENGKFSKKDYRLFKIRGVTGTDDYLSMSEAIERRFSHLQDKDGSFAAYPDLILLDGGKGHVSTVKAKLAEMGIDVPVFGMVKDDYHKTRALTTESEEINIAREQRVFVMIYRIQEEVHRFTVSKMEGAKRRSLRHSTLERVKGIGESKAKALLAAFGGLNAIKTASESEIAAVKGISKTDAKEIYNYFH